MIKKFLENNKYSVQYALNGIEGINLCKSFVPDLIILDIMLPGLNGDDVLQKLRKFTNAPVIVVSAKTMVQTKIELLKIGADDYMTKPFDLYELLARIEANLKRTVDNPYQNNNTLIYKNIKINNSLVYINGVLVPFTSTELSILKLLLQYPQKIFSKQNLYESIWNLIIFVFLMKIFKNKKFDGQMASIYLIGYSIGRFFIEGLRTDSLMFGSFRVAQLISALMIASGILLYNLLKNKKVGPAHREN